MIKDNEYTYDKSEIEPLIQLMPKIMFDRKEMTKLREDFYKIPLEVSESRLSKSSLLFEFFKKLIKESMMNVKIGTGLSNWATTFFGCKVDDFEILNSYKVKELTNPSKSEKKKYDEFQKLQKISLESIKFFRNLQKLENPSSEIVYEELSQGIKQFSGAGMVVIKLFALLYHKYVLPIFKAEHYNEFLAIFQKDVNKKKKWDKILDEGYVLLGYCNLFLKSFYNDGFQYWNCNYVHFLYRMGKFLREPNLRIKLLKYGFQCYPLEEQSIVGLFYTIINRGKIPNKLQKFKNFQTISLQTEYPDLIGNFAGSNKTINIEFEYHSSGYKSHLKNELVSNYVICWDDDRKKKKLFHTHKNIKSLKKHPEIIALKEIIIK